MEVLMVSGWLFILGTPTEHHKQAFPPHPQSAWGFSPPTLSWNTFASTLQAAALKPRSDKLRGVWQAAGGETRLFTREDAAEPQMCLQLPSGEEGRRERQSCRGRSSVYSLTGLFSDHCRTSCSAHIRSQARVPNINTHQGLFKLLLITSLASSELLSSF